MSALAVGGSSSSPSAVPTREAALERAAAVFAEARRVRDSLPVAEAARRAYTPSGPPIAELEARIRALRATR